MVLEKLDNYRQKNKTGPLSYTIYKKSKWVKNLNGPETVKFLEKKEPVNSLTLILVMIFWILSQSKGDGSSSNNNNNNWAT